MSRNVVAEQLCYTKGCYRPRKLLLSSNFSTKNVLIQELLYRKCCYATMFPQKMFLSKNFSIENCVIEPLFYRKSCYRFFRRKIVIEVNFLQQKLLLNHFPIKKGLIFFCPFLFHQHFPNCFKNPYLSGSYVILSHKPQNKDTTNK